MSDYALNVMELCRPDDTARHKYVGFVQISNPEQGINARFDFVCIPTEPGYYFAATCKEKLLFVCRDSISPESQFSADDALRFVQTTVYNRASSIVNELSKTTREIYPKEGESLSFEKPAAKLASNLVCQGGCKFQLKETPARGKIIQLLQRMS